LKSPIKSVFDLTGRLGLGRIPPLKKFLLILAQSLPRRLVLAHTTHGFDIWVDPSSVVGSAILRDGVWEPHVVGAIQRYAKPGMVVVDIGAHVGYYTVLLSRLVGPLGHVYAFEPSKSNLRTLRRNVSENGLGNVTIVPLAVSDTCGHATLHLDAIDSGANSLVRTTGSVRAELVQTTTLDAYMATQKVSGIGIIKMDVEGAELIALKGMRKVLKSNPALVLFIEFTPELVAKTTAHPAQLLYELHSLGFTVLDARTMTPMGFDDAKGEPGIFDLVCLRQPKDATPPPPGTT